MTHIGTVIWQHITLAEYRIKYAKEIIEKSIGSDEMLDSDLSEAASHIEAARYKLSQVGK